jgi:ribosomal protein L37AE/L43A
MEHGRKAAAVSLIDSIMRGLDRLSFAKRRLTLRWRRRKAPCEQCGRTLMNQRLRSPTQVLLGGWTCNACGYAHARRRGVAPSPAPALVPAE